MKIYAKCPDRVKVDYLTAGKLYEVVSKQDDDFFEIIDNDNDKSDPRHCRWEECAHLDGLNWTRIEVKDRADVLAEEAENMVKALREAHDYVQRYLAEDRPDFVEKWGAILARIDEVKG